MVKVDNHFDNGNNVYAGDCVGGAMLAHKASEGIKIVEQIGTVVSLVSIMQTSLGLFTWPEIAWVGTEKECLANGEKIKIGKFPFLASGRSHAMGEMRDFIEVIADSETDMIKESTYLALMRQNLSEAVVAMEFGSSAEDLGEPFTVTQPIRIST